MTSPARPRGFNPFRVLARHRNYRLFWFGQTISLIGTWMQQIATGWLSLQLTNDPFYVGLVSAASTLPILFLSLPAGVLADRVEKIRVVRIAQALMLVEAALLWAFTATGNITVGWLLVIALFGGVFAAFEIPARQSLIVELVAREDMQHAIALNSGAFNLARILGPSVAALVIAQLGIAWCFGLNALSYLAVLAGLAMIRLPREEAFTKDQPPPLAGIREAIDYARRDRTTGILLRLVMSFSFLAIPILTLLPVMARDHLHLGVSGYGALMMCFGAGALLGALVIAGQGGAIPRGPVLTVSALTLCLAIIGFALSTSPVLSGSLLFVSGVTMLTNNSLMNGLVQSRVPDALRGRVMAIYVMLYVGVNPLGSFVAGLIARHSSTPVAIAVMGTALLAIVAWTFRRYPELRTA